MCQTIFGDKEQKDQIRSLECLFFLCASAASVVHRHLDEWGTIPWGNSIAVHFFFFFYVQYGHIGLLVCCSCGPLPQGLQVFSFCPCLQSPPFYVVLLLNAFNIHHSSSFFHSAAATNAGFSSSSNKERANCEHRKRKWLLWQNKSKPKPVQRKPIQNGELRGE